MPFERLTPALAGDILREAEIPVSNDQIRVESRDGKWVAFLPGNRLAWFAATEEGQKKLNTERRILRLLADRCTFRFPRMIFQSSTGDFDVREMVPGVCDPWNVFAVARDRIEVAESLGRQIGRILAQQHTRIQAADVEGWLPRKPSWPMSGDWIRERLPTVVGDPELLAATNGVLSKYESVQISEEDRVLVHTDVGFHNLAIDPESYEILGVFDFEDAAWADRHHDFRYLVFDQNREDLLEAAVEAYEPLTGRKINRERVRLYNAACAVNFLAFRSGIRPEDRSCGRTLEEDLRWVKGAMERLSEGKERGGKQ